MRQKNKHAAGFTELREVLFASISEIAPNALSIQKRLTLYWNLAVGPKVTSVSWVQRLEGETLHVQVADEGWKAALIPLEKNIIYQINRHCHEIQISKIVMKKSKTPLTNKVNKQQTQKDPHKPVMPPTGPATKSSMLVTIEDPELRQTLKRLEGKFRFSSIILVLFCWTFFANCVAQQTTPTNTSINLNNAFSVKEIEKLNKKNAGIEFKDPRAYFHFLMALKAQRKWNLQQAIFHFQKVVEHDSNSEDFHIFLARLYLMTGQFDRLLEFCDRSLQRFPQNSKLALISADVLSARGQTARAVSYLEKGIQNQGDEPTNNYLLAGLIYLKNKNYLQAKEMLVKLTHINPTNPIGFHYLGLLYAQMQKWQEAQKALEYGTNLRPSFKKTKEFLAWVFENQGKLKGAENEYRKLYEQNPTQKKYQLEINRLQSIREKGLPASPAPQPKDSSVHLKLGVMYYEQSNHGEALEELRLYLAEEEALEAKAVRLLIARIFEVYSRYPEAIAELKVLLKMEPQSVEILLQIAHMHNLNKNIEKTIQVLNRAVRLAPKRHELHHSLSLAYMSRNQYALAIEHIRQAINLNPEKDVYFFELGALLERAGAYEEAISTMKQVIELNPNHSNAHNFIGYMYALQGQHLDRAVAHLEKALSIQPQNGYFLDSLGWVYYKKGDHQKALAKIKKAMIYTKPDPVLYDHLGDVYYSLENYGGANRAWKISLSLTQRKMNEEEALGELPDLQGLQDKIRKVQRILNQSL